MSDFAAAVTGWLFISAASMLWLGQTLQPVRIGTFFQTTDFGAVFSRFRVWIWLYRVHIFGYLMTVMAFVALATAVSPSESRIVIWPAVAVLGAGAIVASLAGAFYYHFGAWGALDMDGKSPEQVEAFVGSLEVSTEYVTCLVRFSRVFFGLGQVVLALGCYHGQLLPMWLIVSTALLGVAAMALTMGLPDNLEYYAPLFHLNVLWMIAIGVVVLTSGVDLPSS